MYTIHLSKSIRNKMINVLSHFFWKRGSFFFAHKSRFFLPTSKLLHLALEVFVGFILHDRQPVDQTNKTILSSREKMTKQRHLKISI